MQLIGLHRVALDDLQLADLSGDLRADDDVVGGDDAGEHELGGRAAEVAIGRVAGAAEDEQDEERSKTFHVKHLYKTNV